MNDYDACLSFLYNQLPMFQRKGAAAYKANLDNTYALDQMFKHPHRAFRSIHVGGTNGKGSSSHMLASVLQEAGYKVGLYTSPHLIDFRERIRVNGEMITPEAIMQFVHEYQQRNQDVQVSPSFFELTVIMAFQYFKDQQVDVAIVEVGLGGLLDSTNIITPELALITNVSLDHTNLLGNTVEDIAHEKAGIIKTGIPTVVSESNADYNSVFNSKAEKEQSPIYFADTCALPFAQYELDLKGGYQQKNVQGVLKAIELLQAGDWRIAEEHIRRGLASVRLNTKLRGRWEVVQENPLVVCDTGHNVGGIEQVVRQLKQTCKGELWIVIGMVNDKDQKKVLELLPRHAHYIFTQASMERAMSAKDLAAIAASVGLTGEIIPQVKEAVNHAISKAKGEDLIYVGGSTFVVGDYFL